jgi:RimJ/RimL family protein N-acetyltransferase
MAIILKDQDRHIGNIKIHRIDWFNRCAELSLVIGEKAFWGKGYGAEAIKLAVDYSFNTLNLHRISACVYANNLGSINAFKKADFVEEGRRKSCRFFKGAYVDEDLLGVIRPE